mgnify:CR=1 FL=1
MIPVPLIWGLSLGLASSLHCAGMCGPIGCSILMLGGGDGEPKKMALRLALMQLGRVASYCLLGVLFGTFGAGIYRQLDLSAVHMGLQWIAAGVVLWMGFSTMGLVPAIHGFDRALAPLAGKVASARMVLSQGAPEIALLSGLVWGITPCAMVYTALFTSLLTGSTAGGTALMLGFGLGTIPAVIASSVALHRASRRRRFGDRRLAGGLLIAAGLLGLALTVPGSPLCITGA